MKNKREYGFIIDVKIAEPLKYPNGDLNRKRQEFAMQDAVILFKGKENIFRQNMESSVNVLIQSIMVDFLLNKETNKRIHQFEVREK